MTGGHPGKYPSCEPAAAITSISSENTFSDAYFWLEHPWLKSHLSSGCSFSSEGLTSPQTGNGVRQLCSGGKRKQLKQHSTLKKSKQEIVKMRNQGKDGKQPKIGIKDTSLFPFYFRCYFHLVFHCTMLHILGCAEVCMGIYWGGLLVWLM